MAVLSWARRRRITRAVRGLYSWRLLGATLILSNLLLSSASAPSVRPESQRLGDPTWSGTITYQEEFSSSSRRRSERVEIQVQSLSLQRPLQDEETTYQGPASATIHYTEDRTTGAGGTTWCRECTIETTVTLQVRLVVQQNSGDYLLYFPSISEPGGDDCVFTKGESRLSGSTGQRNPSTISDRQPDGNPNGVTSWQLQRTGIMRLPTYSQAHKHAFRQDAFQLQSYARVATAYSESAEKVLPWIEMGPVQQPTSMTEWVHFVEQHPELLQASRLGVMFPALAAGAEEVLGPAALTLTGGFVGLKATQVLADLLEIVLTNEKEEFERKADDPPDPNFREIAQPVLPPTQALSLPDGVPSRLRDLVDAQQALLENHERTTVFLRAGTTGVERSQGADQAGDLGWRDRQLDAAARYDTEAANLIRSRPALYANLQRSLQQLGYAGEGADIRAGSALLQTHEQAAQALLDFASSARASGGSPEAGSGGNPPRAPGRDPSPTSRPSPSATPLVRSVTPSNGPTRVPASPTTTSPALAASALTATPPSGGGSLDPAGPRTIAVGQTQSSALTAGSSQRTEDLTHYEVWALRAQPGTCVTIVMQSSDFSPYLNVAYDAMGEAILSNDANGGQQARIQARLSRSTPYYIRATSAAADRLGRYTLQVASC